MSERIQTIAARFAPHIRRLVGTRGDALIPRDLDRGLVLLRAVVVALLLVQGARAGVSVLRTSYLLGTIQAEDPEPARTVPPTSLDAYNPVLEKGVLGVPPPPQPQQLFGVLGSVALFGSDPGQVQEYEVGAEVPGGEKIVAIGVESVELEKDGQKRTVTVFPELQQN